ncbi:MAG: patatin-like phospholipase family protein [Desulfobulbus sp.]|nr:patatin-like phospholipase family protein [Desulfobulbus sp.]
MAEVKKNTPAEAPEPQQYYAPIGNDVDYFGAAGVVEEELRLIRFRHQYWEHTHKADAKVEDLCGLALSGGGIRSASFSLGVMQALAYNRWLAEFDYLSTVSGGGYIGSGLTWALNSDPENFGLTDRTFPFASFPMSGEPRFETERRSVQEVLKKRNRVSKWSGRLLHFLRQNANYLVPGSGLNFCTLVWIALRGAAMGLLVYGGLLALFFLVAFQGVLLKEICSPAWLPQVVRQNWIVLIAALGLGCCLLSVPVYSLKTYWHHHPRKRFWEKRESSYGFRRLYERAAGWVLPVLLGLLLVGLIPSVHQVLKTKGEAAGKEPQVREFNLGGKVQASGELSFQGTVSMPGPVPSSAPAKSDPSFFANLFHEVQILLTGIGSALVGLLAGVGILMKGTRADSGKVPLKPLVIVGVCSLLFAITLVAYTVAYAIVVTTGGGSATWWYILGGSLLVPVLALCTNINHISIHRYYRDRLMETFMPDVAEVMAGHYEKTRQSTSADTTPLKDMVQGMYHIVNTNVILAHAKKPKFRSRGGDNFILSPRYCGSNATGWQFTGQFMRGEMTLATAMAISGAAVNPSAGCGGEGLTRLPALSMLMGLLNLRLGYWVPNPRYHDRTWRGRLRNPNFIHPGLYEVMLRTCLNEDRSFIQLSDGGHFENLGLYELIRRKLRLIIVCDAGADPKFSFSDLANAMQKVRTDFGALIMIENEELQPLVPKIDPANGEVACAEQGHLIATIKYTDNTTGTLIYLTTTFFKGLSADLYGYKKVHPNFPDEPTSDQFYDEKQFEAYRELGFQAAWKMMNCVEMDAQTCQQIWPNGIPDCRQKRDKDCA